MPKQRKTRNIVYLLLSLVCTLGIFSFLLTHVSPGQVLRTIREVDYRFFLAFIILALASSFFRALRYQLTLLPAGYSPSLLILFLITLVRNLFSDLLPARIGTTVYIYLANTRLNIPLQLATSSFALSFIFDILALGPLLIAVILLSQATLPFSRLSIIIAALILFLLTSIVLAALPRFLRFAKKVAVRLPAISFSTRKKLIGFSEQVNSEIILARHSGIYFSLFLLSVFVRICKYGALYCFLVGILLPLGIPLAEVNPLTSTIGILSAELAASLPVSGIAGFGAYEGAWALSFSLLGFPEDLASLTAVSHHLFTQAYGYSLGLLAIVLLLLPLSDREDVSPYLFRGKVYYVFRQSALFVCVCALVVICLNLPSRADAKPFSQTSLSESEKTAFKTTVNNLPGDVLFDSNRSGTFGIYILNRDTAETLPLIDEPRIHEMYPAASSDGKWIVYGRTRSLSRLAPAQIWIIARDGNAPRKLIDSGTFPSFSADDSIIYYEQDRARVMAYSMQNGTSREIFPRKKKLFRGREIVKPRVSPDGTSISFTCDVPGHWNAWIAPLGRGEPQRISPGCEPTWFPTGNRLAWVKRSGARGGSGIMDFDVASRSINELQDTEAPLGHEYFPTVDRSGDYLLYSACPADQHDHDSANYQIHISHIPSGKAHQLTFDSATNRWPSLIP